MSLALVQWHPGGSGWPGYQQVLSQPECHSPYSDSWDAPGVIRDICEDLPAVYIEENTFINIQRD